MTVVVFPHDVSAVGVPYQSAPEVQTIRSMIPECQASDWSARVKALSALAEAVGDVKRRAEVVSHTEAIKQVLKDRLGDKNHRVRAGFLCGQSRTQ